MFRSARFASPAAASIVQKTHLSSNVFAAPILSHSSLLRHFEKQQQQQHSGESQGNFFFRRGFFFSAAVAVVTSSYVCDNSNLSPVAMCAPRSSSSSSTAQLEKTIDEHHAKDRVTESYELSRKAVKEGGQDTNPEMLWRYGRALYLMGKNQVADKKKKEEYVRDSVAAISAALQLDANNVSAHKWMGMALGSLGEFLSLTDKIKDTYKIKEQFDKAIQGNPNDATTYHCLGVWSFSLLQVSWVERQVASAIFATPPQTSFEEAEKAFLRSDHLDPTQPHNSIMLGDLYLYKGDKASARKWYEHATKCPANTDYQKEYVKQAEKKLQSL